MAKNKKKKKVTRNKAKDFFTDYYKTNREYAEQNDERNKTEAGKGWSYSEKLMIGIIVLGVIGCIVKYVIL